MLFGEKSVTALALRNAVVELHVLQSDGGIEVGNIGIGGHLGELV